MKKRITKGKKPSSPPARESVYSFEPCDKWTPLKEATIIEEGGEKAIKGKTHMMFKGRIECPNCGVGIWIEYTQEEE